ncbi:allophanate hydrolase subunit 2 [Streptomyces sp. Amel2xB2]|uniref:5-oxoprolinase subunit C family protein n=1 Tax=Streptomyces sp. Amel2xB2 TaxID=1305829 RepID=UPI000DB9E571|nr:biotin-dependent carboxyltransferase family protein [Streptomyces sp. Amel2xB2]RAJ70346.1 allophanate hydrolase subunit 2 [Streptomyces sp. Amel2xB2]
MSVGGLRVVRAGVLTTVQDLGRPGHAHLGVPRSGALDEPAHRLANRLLGNAESAATLETTVDGCAVLLTRDAGDERDGEDDAEGAERRTGTGVGTRTGTRTGTEAVVTGAPCAVAVDGRPAPWGVPFRVPWGAVLEAGPAERGLRSYVAFAGGVDAEPVLGSRATDLLSGLGPEPLREGTRLRLGDLHGFDSDRDRDAVRKGNRRREPYRRTEGTPERNGHRPPAHGRTAGLRYAPDAAPWAAPPRELLLPVVHGPRADWFTDGALRTLATGAYRVSADGNRIGLRLEGPVLERSRDGELPSEGIALGALQVPPEGRPVLFLADHPVTGGYPVIGVVPQEALAAAAQAVPGTPVRFMPVSG